MNPYEVLEISPGASADEIKAAYHQMAKLWHPDRFTGDAKPEAERRFRLLAEAFNMLKDTGRRESMEGAAPPRPTPPPPASPAAPAQAQAPAPAASPAPQNHPSGPIQLDSGAGVTRTKTVDEWFQEAKAAHDAKAYDRSLGLIQYAMRLDPERGEFQAFYAKLLDVTGGDKRLLVRTLETALRLNPKDVDSTILLAQTFQNLGMHARASKLWSVVHNLSPGHAVFGGPAKKGEAKGAKAKAAAGAQSMKDQWANLVGDLREKINTLFKRG